MEIRRSGSHASGKGPAEYFTGTVRVDPLFEAHDPARALGVSVAFEPGARRAWHAQMQKGRIASYPSSPTRFLF